MQSFPFLVPSLDLYNMRPNFFELLKLKVKRGLFFIFNASPPFLQPFSCIWVFLANQYPLPEFYYFKKLHLSDFYFRNKRLEFFDLRCKLSFFYILPPLKNYFFLLLFKKLLFILQYSISNALSENRTISKRLSPKCVCKLSWSALPFQVLQQHPFLLRL